MIDAHMDSLERLLAIEEIRQLKARRCRCVDEKDWEGYAACHTPGCVSYALAKPTVGAKTMAEQIKSQIEHRTTVHHVHSPEIELTSETTANGTPFESNPVVNVWRKLWRETWESPTRSEERRVGKECYGRC